MRRNIKNDKVIKAITIGLATMIAATSVPVDLYAADENNNSSEAGEDNESSSVDTASEAADTAEKSTETAETSFETAVESIVSGDAQNKLDPAVPEDGGNNVANLITIANRFIDNTTGEVITDNYTDAIDLLNAVQDNTVVPVNPENPEDPAFQDDLTDAKAWDAKADTYAENAVSDVEAAKDIAHSATISVSGVSDKAVEVQDKLDNGNVDEAKTAFGEFDEQTNQVEQDLASKQAAFADLKTKYNIAIGKLRACELAYNNSLSTSAENAEKAADKLKAAKDDADKLSKALNDAKKDLDKKEVDTATAIGNNNSASAASWDKQRPVMKNILINYYLPEGATLVKYVDVQKGFDTQNNNYATLIYKDADGVEHTQYFNYDRSDREIKEDDRWYKNLGSAKDIVIYEKTAEEISANAYVTDYYAGTAVEKLKNEKFGEFKKNVNKGYYDVFAFVDGEGNTTYKVRDEVNAGVADGTITESDGVYYLDGIEGHKVVITTSDNASNIIDVKNDQGVNDFVATAMKYDTYGRKIEKAKKDVQAAQNDVKKLQTAIKDLHRDNRFIRVLPDQVVIDDVIGDLGPALTDDEIGMIKNAGTIEEAITILTNLLNDAEDELNNASDQLDELKQVRDELRKKLYPDEPNHNQEDERTDDSSDDDTVIPGPGGFTYTIPGGFTLPATLLDGTTGTTGGTTTGSGVLGVRTGGGQEENDEGRKDEGIAPRANFSTVNKVLGSRQKKDNSQLAKKIKDNEIPLAEIPNMDDEVTMNWMWLLIIFLLGATGKKLYDEYKKKKEAEKAAKIDK